MSTLFNKWALAGLIAANLLSLAQAQTGASVSKIVVPFAAGGARELPARSIQQELSKELG